MVRPTGMLPPDASFFADTVVVWPPGDAQGPSGEPIDFDPDATEGTALAAMVTEYGSAHLGVSPAGGEATGRIKLRATFPADPGVTAAGQPLRWTHHGGAALATPLDFASDGPAIPHGGLGAGYWIVDGALVV